MSARACASRTGIARGRARIAAATLWLWGMSCGAAEVATPPQTTPDESTAPHDLTEDAGRWRRIHASQLDPDRDAERLDQIRQLEAIGYVSGSVPAGLASGVETRIEDKMAEGLTLITSGHAPEAFLIDARGAVLHRWSRTYAEIWPERAAADPDEQTTFWRRTRLLPNGHLLAIFDGRGIIELDAHSNLVWAQWNGAHHDMDVGDDGKIYVLTRQAQLLPDVNPDRPILEDFIEVLDADGARLRRISLLEAFESSDFAGAARPAYARAGDLFHTNTVSLLDGQIVEEAPAFAAGNLMLSSFALHWLAVLDPERETIVWLQRGGFRNQHDPQILQNGNMLLFDNRGENVGDHHASAVLELDPVTGHERWAYRGTEASPFYSSTCGAAQRLPNGNTLISESDRGRAFEVTPDGEIVWQYRNPHRAGEANDLIATLFEAWRLPPDFPLGWLEAPGHP